MIMRILIGLLVSLGGFLMVYKTQFILDMVGYVDWAEKHLGQGGSRLFYKLLGTVIILIGFLVITNLYDMVIGGFILGVFGGRPL
jgi:hypothetical protein